MRVCRSATSPAPFIQTLRIGQGYHANAAQSAGRLIRALDNARPLPHDYGAPAQNRLRRRRTKMSLDLGGVTIANAEEKFVEMSHGTTRYVEAGDGYPTILVHGVSYTSGAHDWALNIGPLSAKLRVIAVDALGWGKGEGWLQQEYSFAYLVDFIREFQDALGLEKTNLVGHSMGGWLASLFGYESPHRTTNSFSSPAAERCPGNSAAWSSSRPLPGTMSSRGSRAA